MKNIRLIAAITALFLMSLTTVSAQKIATWKGGAPGRGSDWTCSQNWVEGRTPNEFSDVFIPDVSTTTGCLPVIRQEVESVNSLTLCAGAKLQITKSGSLYVVAFIQMPDPSAIRNNGEFLLDSVSQSLTVRK